MSIDRVDVGPAGGRIAELVALATETTNRLEKLWDEVGYSSCEKRRQMGGLLDGFRTLCENKVRRCSTVVCVFMSVKALFVVMGRTASRHTRNFKLSFR